MILERNLDNQNKKATQKGGPNGLGRNIEEWRAGLRPA